MPEGIIYITRTPQDLPNYYKVGRTKYTTEERVRPDATYISGGIKKIKAYRVTDDIEAEKAAHIALSDVRVDLPHAREIFELDIDILIGKVKLAIKPWIIEQGQNNFQNNWILDFLSLPSTRIANYHHRDLEIDNRINLIIELMMRVIARGASAAERRIENRSYEDLINDLNVGNTLEATLKNIDHQALADIDNWHKKFEVILYLSKAPLMMKINNFNGRFEGPLLRRGIEDLRSGLNGFNINEVIGYWSDNYFSSNPRLIMGCYQFLNDKIYKWNSDPEVEKDIFVRGTKNSVYKNAIAYCLNNPNANSLEISEKTKSEIERAGIERINENIGSTLWEEFDRVRADIRTDIKNNAKLLLDYFDDNKLNYILLNRVEKKQIKLSEALRIFKIVNDTKWVKEIKKGQNFTMEHKNIISLNDIYQGKITLDEALEKNRKLKEVEKQMK